MSSSENNSPPRNFSQREAYAYLLKTISKALEEDKPVDTSDWPEPLTVERAQQILRDNLGPVEEET